MWKLAWDLVAGGVTTWMGDKVEQREHERELKKVRREHALEAAAKDQSEELDWNRLMAKGSQESWKDEWWTVILTAPLIMLFWPTGDEKSVHQIALDGFARLDQAPQWYTAAVGLCIAAAFGYRQFVKPFMKSK